MKEALSSAWNLVVPRDDSFLVSVERALVDAAFIVPFGMDDIRYAIVYGESSSAIKGTIFIFLAMVLNRKVILPPMRSGKEQKPPKPPALPPGSPTGMS